MESRKKVPMNYLQGSNGKTDIENRLTDMGWCGEEKVKCMGTVTCKLTLPYVKETASGNLLYDSRNSNRGSIAT